MQSFSCRSSPPSCSPTPCSSTSRRRIETQDMNRSLIAIVALACAAVLFVGINIIADKTLHSARVDLTQQRLFTLSDGSRKTLAKIDEPITVRFYYSKRLGTEIPTYALYAQRVREMLEE